MVERRLEGVEDRAGGDGIGLRTTVQRDRVTTLAADQAGTRGALVVEVLAPGRDARDAGVLVQTLPMFRLDQDMIVTIDGPAASGKTATAEALAGALGLQVLSTGAMYRCATAIALDHHIAREHTYRLLEVVRSAHMHFDWHTKSPEGRPSPEVMAFGKSYARRIMDEEVTSRVSEYSEVIPLRELMVGMQREIAKGHRRLVSEGRDQGSVVFPEAHVKFYLFASPRVRAERRRAQLHAKKGIDRDIDELEREIQQRDENDRRKPYGALVKPADALEVNSDEMDLAGVVALMKRHVMERARVG